MLRAAPPRILALSLVSLAVALVPCCAGGHEHPVQAPQQPLAEAEKERFIGAFHQLTAAEIERRRMAARPIDLRLLRIDVSDKMRSASFGHTTAVLVPDGVVGGPKSPDQAKQFYVEYGPSTNAPAAWFGPFPMAQAAQGPPALSEATRERIVASYRALKVGEGERIAALPTDGQFVKIDVSDKIRSVSFGHSTTLLVPAGATGRPADPNQATSFYVEFGRSTNRPGGIYGPYPIGAATPGGSAR